MRSVAVHTLGCRLNRYESDGILQKFVESGRYEARSIEEGPDVAIVNSCTVTDQADGRNRQAIRQILRKNPNCSIVVTGCFAQTDPDLLRELPGVALVVGNDRKSRLFELLEQHFQKTATAMPFEAVLDHRMRPGIEEPFAYGAVLPQGHTRAYLKIQDGCDRRCSYCKIPMARGRGISRAYAAIQEHLRVLESQAVPEVVLTGVNLGWYRDPETKQRFVPMLEELLGGLSHTRLRLSSIEPCDVDAPLARLTTHPLLCSFLHVPVQSGSTAILRRMRRTYSAESFRRRVETAKGINPDIFLGTDLIVGFPGESEADFQASLTLLEQLEFARIHAFPFSPRRQTVAAQLPGRVPPGIVRERMARVRELSKRLALRYARRFIGTAREAVLEPGRQPGVWHGLTDNFLRVELPAGMSAESCLVSVTIDRVDEHGVKGSLLARA